MPGDAPRTGDTPVTRFVPVIAALALAGAGALLDAQQRFTSRAEAVRVDVAVTDGNRFVRNLTASDFDVRDSGVRQAVELLEVDQIPLNIIVVLDTSGSVAGRRLQYLIEAVQALVTGLREPDRTALLSFATRVRLRSPLSRQRGGLLAALAGLEGAGSTSLRDAAFAGLALREADPGRTLMLLFSDGADTSSWLTPDKVLDTAKRTDVVVYPVGLREGTSIGATAGPLKRGVPVERAGKFLHDLADATGGRVMLAGTDADLRDTFIRTLAEFRDRYVLTYEPSGVAAGGWHPIEVRLKGKRGKVTARRGYFAQ